MHTRMRYPLGIGYFGGEEFRFYCQSGLCYFSNTLNMCTIPQQYYCTSLLYEQSHTAKVWEKIVAELGFRLSSVGRVLFKKINLSVKLIGVIVSHLKVTKLTKNEDPSKSPSILINEQS